MDGAYFGFRHLKAILDKTEFIRGDLREVQTDEAFRERLLKDCECVIHLAAISNDPSADLDVELTDEINCKATEHLALAAKERGMKFIFSSSCAVYGSNEKMVDENGALGPVTTYARSKVKAEKTLLSLSDKNWSPVILRNGTLFGLSGRMRFDLVVNIFSLYSVLYREIKVFGDGLYWRPFLHVADCARAFVHFAEREKCRYPLYNISHHNLQICDLVPIFQRLSPNLKVTHVKIESTEERNYKVLTQRAKDEGFNTRIEIEFGSEEMIDALVSGVIRKPEALYYRNAKWMEELIQDGKLEKKKSRFPIRKNLKKEIEH